MQGRPPHCRGLIVMRSSKDDMYKFVSLTVALLIMNDSCEPFPTAAIIDDEIEECNQITRKHYGDRANEVK
jgi:hypothetical protein